MYFLECFFFRLFNPSYWTMNYKYSKIWDEELIRLISEHDFVPVDRFFADIGGCRLWVENRPYGAMIPLNMRFRASCLTTSRAIRLYARNLVEMEKEIRKKNEN